MVSRHLPGPDSEGLKPYSRTRTRSRQYSYSFVVSLGLGAVVRGHPQMYLVILNRRIIHGKALKAVSLLALHDTVSALTRC